MNNSSHLTILDLPEEILLYIFTKVHNLDVLYSLIGSCKKLDVHVCDRTLTRSIDLTRLVSNEFCSQLLPRIHHNIQYLTIDPCWLEHIRLHAQNFINLHRLHLTDTNVFTASNIFQETNSTMLDFKDQIHELNLTICNKNTSTFNLHVDIYRQIFCLFTNLKCLYLDSTGEFVFTEALLDNLPSTICSSSTITYLNIRLNIIDDCFLLLDGRFSQLHTLIVKLDFIHYQALLQTPSLETLGHSIILCDKTKDFEKLKSFSLFAQHFTDEFETLILRLLRRMIHLETLSLSLCLYLRDRLIDYNYLEDILLKNFKCLNI